ncbi:hypothetical protein EA187_00325 [Lujinxingia sediminis]|uniref:SH3 domain-containing protein n=1 Tax=Lujinxingia sediminis TaxID=2480984 RepID=A0ABY0CVL9_9DELT|nr:hypothetical protein [Lujinxingia sediminis]RVU47917.1 hypothetical protein EA187_00325 [Lujinxingia sediminis]
MNSDERRAKNNVEVAALLMLLMLPGGWVGCDRGGAPESPAAPGVPVEREEAPEVVAPAEPDVDEVQPSGPPEGPLSFASWPGREELHTFDLMWLGGEREVRLHEAPDASSAQVGQASWMDTEEIVWEDTRVQVLEPTSYEVIRALELAGLAYDEDFEELDAEEVRLALEEGEQVALYQYGGEGTCFVGARDQVLLGPCPNEEMGLRKVARPDADVLPQERAAQGAAHPEVKERWSPLEQQWWVKVRHNAHSGWMRVDDAPVEVHVRLIEGYE